MHAVHFPIGMNKSDALQVGKIAALTLVAWSTPPRLWRKAAAALPNFGLVYPGPSLSVYQRIFGLAFNADALSDLNDKRRICSREAVLQILGLKGTWRSWRPEIRLRGEAHLQKAIDKGTGAILWVTDSNYSTLIFKIAMHRAGYRLSQLSRPNHGFSNSPFGIRFLNPIWSNVEDRFLEERVTIKDDNAAPALEILRDRLAANRVVSIAVGAVAHRFADVPFFQHSLRLPTGPLRLMRDTGAPIFPAFVFATGDGSLEVTIESALPLFEEPQAFERSAIAYAKLLEPYVSKYPEQWTGWGFLLPEEKPILSG